MRVNKLPPVVNEIIEQYFNLDFYGVKVKTPYFRNVKRVRAELRVLGGKGLPYEIVEETKIYSKLRDVPIKGKSENVIREFMQSQGIGIDCSGFVAHVFDTWLKKSNAGQLRTNVIFEDKSLYRSLVRIIRPIENISAQVLTNRRNTSIITLSQIEPGDMIRLKGLKQGDHIALIESVEYEVSTPTKFTYVHSSPHYGKENGMRRGEVVITDIKGELKNQKWCELDTEGNCPTLNELLIDYEDNGLRRANFFNKLMR